MNWGFLHLKNLEKECQIKPELAENTSDESRNQ